MNLFAIIFNDAISAGTKAQLRETFADNNFFQLSDRVFLVRSYVSNPNNVSSIAGIGPSKSDDEASRSGVVFRLNGSYYGYYNGRLWDWLAEHRPV